MIMRNTHCIVYNRYSKLKCFKLFGSIPCWSISDWWYSVKVGHFLTKAKFEGKHFSTQDYYRLTSKKQSRGLVTHSENLKLFNDFTWRTLEEIQGKLLCVVKRKGTMQEKAKSTLLKLKFSSSMAKINRNQLWLLLKSILDCFALWVQGSFFSNLVKKQIAMGAKA